VFLHQFLGVYLAGLYLGGGLCGAEDGQAVFDESVSNTGCQGRLGADYGKVNPAFPGEFDQ